jgi:hypothetical protein
VHREDGIASELVDEPDLELRRRTYAFFVEHGRPPLAAELGDAAEVVAGRRLGLTGAFWQLA